MVKYKILFLLMGAIVILNSGCRDQRNQKYKENSICGTSFVFYSPENVVELLEDEFLLEEDGSGYRLSVLESDKFKALKSFKAIRLSFCMDKVTYTAKPNPIECSWVPMETNYFYSVNQDSCIFFTGKNRNEIALHETEYYDQEKIEELLNQRIKESKNQRIKDR